MVSAVVFNESSLGQTPQANSSPPNQTNATQGQPAITPSTQQAQKSSTEIAPADQRIMADIQEIRAMLGGGLDREFEEIHKTLQQSPAALASPTPRVAFDSVTTTLGGIENVREDRDKTAGELFSRELGEMVRASSQSLLLKAASKTERPLPTAQQDSGQPIAQRSGRSADRQINSSSPEDSRAALRQCARDLEQIAGTLEQIKAYKNADTVRREAAQLWEKARMEWSDGAAKIWLG